eukprot:CAMPEP_0202455470 /NCGR_PEP_ID=MMETSP1360-20130828/12997_1 /ASSEMBLY_ACC=CAM_ASM_000848 /TAXON_ID=515479 /ORGANISM="Licmophora paradoxa, Strain CCMP2313" /LENGTH=873 /DNA_ID=CAMNT_0049075061 /DNA_START=128 /DNA_END=2749 /DNA_ORIENTATION=-
MIPSGSPSDLPSVTPSVMPSATPSSLPTLSPSDGPSVLPSLSPSSSPTDLPSTSPSVSSQPSSVPTSSPSVNPSLTPSTTPSSLPTLSSSDGPSVLPSLSPSSPFLVECPSDEVNIFTSVAAIGMAVSDSGDISNIQPEEVTLLQDVFINSYNTLTFTLCDSLFRSIKSTSFVLQAARRMRVVSNELDEEYANEALDPYDSSAAKGGKRRRAEERVTVDYQADVNGTCLRCSSDTTIFDSSRGRRRNLRLSYPDENVFEVEEKPQHRRLMELFGQFTPPPFPIPGTGMCRCSPEAAIQTRAGPTRAGPSADEFTAAYDESVGALSASGELPNIAGIINVEELEVVDCPSDIQILTSTLFVGFGVGENSPTGEDVTQLEGSFGSSYNEATNSRCDEQFRTVSSTSFTVQAFRRRLLGSPSEENIEDPSNYVGGAKIHRLLDERVTVDYQADVNGTCSRCSSSTTLFDDSRGRRRLSSSGSSFSRRSMSRRMQTSGDSCFCPADSSFEGTAPSADEFQDTYNSAVVDLGLSSVTGVVAFRELPKDTSSPSVSPTSVPTGTPSGAPTKTPSSLPTLSPSDGPSVLPSLSPSSVPSVLASLSPSVSSQPSNEPSYLPSITPTLTPSLTSSVEPTVVASSLPSVRPSTSPSIEPTVPPTSTPSSHSPSLEPSAMPSRPFYINCPSKVGSFSSRSSIGFTLKDTEQTEASDDEINLLEESFVAGYNFLSFKLCDTLFRSISSTTFSLQSVRRRLFGDKYPHKGGYRKLESITVDYQANVNGTCRLCPADITLFDDSRGTQRQLLYSQHNRRQQVVIELPPPPELASCVCAADTNFEGTAPTVEEFTNFYNESVAELSTDGNLNSIGGVASVVEVMSMPR